MHAHTHGVVLLSVPAQLRRSPSISAGERTLRRRARSLRSSGPIRRRFCRYYEFKYILPWLKGTITISHGLLQIMARGMQSLHSPWQDIERRWKVNKIIKWARPCFIGMSLGLRNKIIYLKKKKKNVSFNNKKKTHRFYHSLTLILKTQCVKISST